MKRFFFCLLFVLPAVLSGQVLKTAAVPYTKGATPYTPNTATSSEIRVDTSCSCVYWWDRDALTWRRSPYGVDVITGGVAPAYTPYDNMGLFAVNASSELYYYNGSTWDQIGGGTAGGIYGGSDTVPDGTIATLADDFFIQGGNISSMTITTGDTIGGQYFSNINGASVIFRDTSGDNTFTAHGNGFSLTTAGGTTDHFLIAGRDARYAADYSSLYSDRSLVDKEYVDGEITAGISVPDGEIAFGAPTDDAITSDAGLLFDGNGVEITQGNAYVGLYGSSSAQFFAADQSASGATKGGKLLLSSEDGAAMASGDRLGIVYFNGQTGVGGTGTGATIEAYTGGAWGGGDAPGELRLYTTPDGSATPAERVTISHSGAVKFSPYGVGAFPGTAAYGLGVDASGNIIETAATGSAGLGGIYSGSGSIFAGGADVTFNGTNPLRFRRAGASAEPIVQKLFSSGTTGYFDRFRINNDSMDFFYALGRFVWQSKGTGMSFACDTGNIQIETQVGFGSFSADSVKINEMPIRPEVYYMVGSDNDGYLKRIVGSASGDLLVWDTAGADHWEVRDGANYVHNYTSGTIRPAQLTAKTDDWNPTGYSTTRRQTIEVSGDASFRCVTGLTAATRDGVEKVVSNSGTNCLVFAKQHTGSAAANRFNISKDVIMLPGMEATFRYDSVGAAWRLKATSKDDVTFNALTETSLKDAFSTTTGDYPAFSWTTNGGAFSGSGPSGTTFRNRFFQFSTSTAATAWPTLSTKVREIYIDSDFSYHRMAGRVRIEDLATGADAFEVRFGYKTTLDTNIVEGAYINYNYTENSGGWTLKTHDGSTLTTTNAGAAVTADTWYNLELIYYPYGEVTAFINGTRYTTTSTLPEAIAANPFLQLDKDEGSTGITARLIYVTAFDTYGCNVSE